MFTKRKTYQDSCEFGCEIVEWKRKFCGNTLHSDTCIFEAGLWNADMLKVDMLNPCFLISGCDGDGRYWAPSMRDSQDSLWDSIFERILCWILVHELLEAKQRFQEECDSYATVTGCRRGWPHKCILIAFWGAWLTWLCTSVYSTCDMMCPYHTDQ